MTNTNYDAYPEGLRPLYAVLEEARALSKGIEAATGSMRADGDPSDAAIELLLTLDSIGPRTVPQLAAERGVSRQNIQVMVNALLKGRYVLNIENPEHRRSSLIWFTPAGMVFLDGYKAKRDALVASLDVDVPAMVLKGTARVLKGLREGLEKAAGLAQGPAQGATEATSGTEAPSEG